MIFDSEYQKLSPEQQEIVQEQLQRMTSACQKIGALASDANFDSIYAELCRDRYKENEGMLFSEADYLAAAFNLREQGQLEMDEALQRRQEREASAREAARQRSRAQKLEQRDRAEGLNPRGHMSDEERQAEAEQKARNLENFKEARRRELEEARGKAQAAAASAREIEENPARFVPDWTGDGASREVLSALHPKVLRLYVRKRALYEQELAIKANDQKKHKQ